MLGCPGLSFDELGYFYPFQTLEIILFVAVEHDQAVLMDDLTPGFVEDPAFVIGGTQERDDTDDQGDGVFPDEDAPGAFLSGDDERCQNQQTNQKKQKLVANGDGEQHMALQGKVGFPFFGQLILDCINRTENAMTQEHSFKAAELCLKCQEVAEYVGPKMS